MSKLHGATFVDVDDVSARSEAVANEAACKLVNRMLHSHGVRHSYETRAFVETFQGVAFTETLRTIANEHRLHLSTTEHSRWVADEEQAVIEHMREVGVEAAPHIAEVLSELDAAAHPVWFVSSSQINRLVVTFEEAGLSDFAPRERIISAQSDFDPPRPKPDPSCYHLALERSGVRAENAVAIEDSRSGVRASSQVMTTVAYLGLKEPAAIEPLISHHSKCGVNLFITDWRWYPEILSMMNTGRWGEACEKFSANAVLSRAGL